MKIGRLADISLIFVAIIWGTGFIGIEYALNAHAHPVLILFVRFGIAALIMGIVFIKDIIKLSKNDIVHGVIAGIILYLAFYFQILGQTMTIVSNAAFITATNVIMVPFIVWGLTRVKPDMKNFVLSFLAIIGIGFLTISFGQGGIQFSPGDGLIFISAILFALHISYIGVFIKQINVKSFTFIQMMTAAVLSLLAWVILGEKVTEGLIIKEAIGPIIYLGVFCTCICFLVQTAAQKSVAPSKAGIILSMEGFFGSLFSVMLGIDHLTINLMVGGFLVLSSVILIEVDFSKYSLRTKSSRVR